jgi:hypothetical protein
MRTNDQAGARQPGAVALRKNGRARRRHSSSSAATGCSQLVFCAAAFFSSVLCHYGRMVSIGAQLTDNVTS